MEASTLRRDAPESFEDAAQTLRECHDAGRTVRLRGGGTKLGWGNEIRTDVEVSTQSLDQVVEHNEGDLTAVLQAGVPLARAQKTFAAAGQMLALDPPEGAHGGAGITVGGTVATADSGPLRHRYGGPRDLVIGVTAALADGTIARAGGKVIKNVAGYDLGKLMAGAFGTLGLILQVSVRLHPWPRTVATASGSTASPDVLGHAAALLGRLPLEADALDVSWKDGSGGVLVRFSGETAADRARAACGRIEEVGLNGDVLEDDAGAWAAQRAHQRAREGSVLRVSALPAELPRVLRAADRVQASVVGRAALGLSWLRLAPAGDDDAVAAIEELRRELRPFPCTLLDAPAGVRGATDPWGETNPGALALHRRVKERFDPAGTCNPGLYVGAI